MRILTLFLTAASVSVLATGCTPGGQAGNGEEGVPQVALARSLGVRSSPLGSAGPDSRSQPGGQEHSLSQSRTTAIVTAAERVAPAVVSVNVLRQQQIRGRSVFDDFFTPFLPPSRSRTLVGYGSGFVVDPAGYILTNDHVVRSAQEIRVTFPDGRDMTAELVGSDPITDVAVLKVEGEDLPVAPVGTSQGLLIGEWTLAIGNPFAYLLSNSEPTVTAGVVSAANRHIIPTGEDQGFYLGMIQTDASINPGNSGGPLVNAMGEVIGVNTSIFSRSGGSEGLGFAIPIDRALKVAQDLIQFREVRRAWTGVDVEAVEADAWGHSRGVRISQVVPGSPADEAGLSPGDHLVRANGQDLFTPLDLEAVLLDLRAGEPVELEVEGRRRPYRLLTETLPTSRAERVEVLRDLEVVTVTPEIEAEQDLGVEFGALITGISPALQQSLGLRPGDVIVQINDQRIMTAEDAAQVLGSLRGGAQALIRWVRRGGLMSRRFYIRR